MTYHLVCALAAADRGRRRALAQPQAEAGGPRGRSSWGLRLAAPPRSVLRAPRGVACGVRSWRAWTGIAGVECVSYKNLVQRSG